MTEFNLADLFESVVDAIPDSEALVAGEERLTYRQLDEGANRLAHVLAQRGIGPGDHVGLYMYNSRQHVEAFLAAFKLRAVPINVNYRYVADELAYLFGDSDLAALIADREFCPVLSALGDALDGIGTVLVVDDDSGESCEGLGALDYDTEVDAASPERDFAPRSADDHYILYTGGTTGMPKGVVWRHEDIFFAALSGGRPGGDPVSTPEELAAEYVPGDSLSMLVLPPLMHGAAQWSTLIGLFMGQRLVLNTQRRFEAEAMWRLVETESVFSLGIVGDAMGRPLIEAFEAMDPRPDVSSLFTVASGGAIWSDAVKARYRELLPNAMLVDAYGSSETGSQGVGLTADSGDEEGLPRFHMSEDHTVLDENLQPVEPGSGNRGHVARSGHIPLGYYGDEVKTAKTFVEVDGRRWVLQGDEATIEADGSITMFGRGRCASTPVAKRCFPRRSRRRSRPMTLYSMRSSSGCPTTSGVRWWWAWCSRARAPHLMPRK